MTALLFATLSNALGALVVSVALVIWLFRQF